MIGIVNEKIVIYFYIVSHILMQIDTPKYVVRLIFIIFDTNQIS